MKIFQIPLFEAMSEAELADMQALHCMRTKVFEKNAVILHSGDRVRDLGIVLNGSVLIENVNVWGDKSILSRVEPGQVFAESYAPVSYTHLDVYKRQPPAIPTCIT